jgi:hypothetical protein
MEEESLAKVRRGLVFLSYFQGRLPLYPQLLSEKDGVSSEKFNEASSSSLLNLKFLFREGDGVSRKKYCCFLCMIKILLLLGNGKGGDDIQSKDAGFVIT